MRPTIVVLQNKSAYCGHFFFFFFFAMLGSKTFKLYRNILKSQTRKAKVAYFTRRLVDSGNNIKKTWDMIKDATQKSTKPLGCPESLKRDD